VFRSPFPIIYAADVERSVRFYVDAFGFAQTFRWPAEGELEYAFLRLGECGIGVGRAAEPIHGLPVAPTGTTRNFELCIYTDDTDAAAARLRELGAVELLPPADQPWNERLCYFTDPDGNPLHISAPITSIAESH
jgi:lactoylglutathione lyase